MTPDKLLFTSALLGIFVLAGGGYGGLYGLGRLWSRAVLVHAGQACWVVAFGVALAIAAATPLHVGWKFLILASALVYAIVPPLTWRYMERLHVDGGAGT